MGGDEFVVLAPDIEKASLEENAQRFRDAVEMTGVRLWLCRVILQHRRGCLRPAGGRWWMRSPSLPRRTEGMYSNKRRSNALAAAITGRRNAGRRTRTREVAHGLASLCWPLHP